MLFVVMAIAARIVGFRRPGILSGIFAIGYGLARIACELFREPDEQLGFLIGSAIGPLGGGITMGQILSLPLVIGGALLIWASARHFRTRGLSGNAAA